MSVFGLLRIVRALFGLAGVGYALVGCSSINNAQALGLEVGIYRLGVAFGCLAVFGGMRWLINRLHLRRHGVPHPSLKKDWSL